MFISPRKWFCKSVARGCAAAAPGLAVATWGRTVGASKYSVAQNDRYKQDSRETTGEGSEAFRVRLHLAPQGVHLSPSTVSQPESVPLRNACGVRAELTGVTWAAPHSSQQEQEPL
ncbi:hypothetical protein NDU88_006378 [Pleurodeles waltl]|uniref:Secreted protein n=1 Tax=Pleurodeles waltl TaxID=8319 RepID=A0AAV7RR22_PLEWA|nr:hypothetical protein NDU88_006378 [Pleurodeles waltl]